MWIVRLALSRPYTFVVMSLLIAIVGIASVVSMPTDIFPNIDIPVVSVIWTYTGLPPAEVEQRITTVFERAMTTTVSDIEHIESQTLTGLTVIKVYFHPNVKIEMAVAQITALAQTIVRLLPPGITPPLIVKYDASSVPIIQLGLKGDGMSESQVYDYGLNFVRTQLAVVQGAQVLPPYGGKQRQIMVDLDPKALYAKGISPADVSAAVNQQSLILPSGSAKIGTREYVVRLNSSPEVLDALNDMPVKQVNGATVRVRDVAQVHDGFAVQTNIVRQDGSRSALLTVLKGGGSSTLSIIDRVKAALPKILTTLPPELHVNPMFDQSVFVRAAIEGVVREALIAALLTGLMILLFLGSWRSTVIVCISIPLSVLVAFIVMYFTGETVNSMTLGGLALAVGILVDDATVEIENIHRNLQQKKTLVRAILDGAQEIAVPALVSTLCICIVFIPVVLLRGAARFLFTPLAKAVVVSVMASYLLSRTIIPTLVKYLLAGEVHDEHASQSLLGRVHGAFNRLFERFTGVYATALKWSLLHRPLVATGFLAFVTASLALAPRIGEDFFPSVDAGQIRLHVRTAVGTRIEEAERRFADVEAAIRGIIPPAELDAVLDDIGVPDAVLLAFSDSSTVSDGDGDILVSLKEGHAPTDEYVRKLRRELAHQFPDLSFFFAPAAITNQILNFGLPAPIDVQVVGRDLPGNLKVAQELVHRIGALPGAADVHLHQQTDHPELRVEVDRTRASQLGLTQRDVASSVLTSVSGSTQVAPNFWLNPKNGVNYKLAVQTPTWRMDSLDALVETPVAAAGSTQQLRNLAQVTRGASQSVINHYNVQPVFDVYANVDRTDLGTFARAVDAIVADVSTRLPRGTSIAIRGQVQTMRSSFWSLGLGMVFAIVLVYLLMAVNFQSWVDPFIILTALPGGLAGILWMLYVTQTTFSVPSLMGAIMCVGVATANSILMVTFANDRRRDGTGALAAALQAGTTRLRPVTMTALAMTIGMLPMALGLGEGGESNAPLGRAVIGGLSLATLATLFFVPVIYTYLRREAPVDPEEALAREEEAH